MKKLPYATQWIMDDDIEAVKDVLNSPYLTQGPLVEKFEKTMAGYCGAKYAVAVSSGTAALHIACLAAGFNEGDEVITSPITFVASANAVLYCGAEPVFADVKKATITIDPREIEKKITKRTKGIIPVDFAGHPVDLKEIKRIADKYGLIVIEDAAHALGAVYRGKQVGNGQYADMTILSFHPVKHITTGEGGMVLTNDKECYERLKILRVHGITRDFPKITIDRGPWYYEMRELGFNYRITDFQCALGLSQLKKLDRFIERRQQIVDRYNRAFFGRKEITLLKTEGTVRSANHLYILQFNVGLRGKIFTEYHRRGILVNVHYIPVYSQPYYKKLGYKQGICPVAEHYYERAITLPLYPKMTNTDITRVVKVTNDILLELGTKK